MSTPEFEQIVEYSFNEKSACFVIRFLDGSSYMLTLDSLPKKMQTKKPDWSNSKLNSLRTGILVQAGEETREIPSHIIHSRGKIV